MKTKWMIGLMTLFFAGWSAGTARANFVLEDTGHRDVTTSHDTGVLWNSSTADVLTGGYIGNAYVNDDASLDVKYPNSTSGPSVYNLYAYNNSTVDISGGSVSSLWARNSSTVNVSGGTVVDYFRAYDSSTVNVSGGLVGDHYYSSGLDAYDSSTVNVSVGMVRQLNANDTSTVNVSGGTVGNYNYYGSSYLSASATSTVNISGGSVSEIRAYDNSSVDISGGLVGELQAYGSSTVTLHGYDFRATGGLSLDGDKVLGTGVLTGRWYGPDVTIWAIPIPGHASSATILALPEPATLTLLALGGLAMMRRGPGRKPKTPRKAR